MQKSTILATTFAAFIFGLGLTTGVPAARANLNLVPQREGEIKLSNVSCIVDAKDCIDTQKELGYTVTSLPFDYDNQRNQYGISRLFVDNRNTANTWVRQPGFGISFQTTDAGTNPEQNQFWFRPVAYLGRTAESLPTGTTVENGQLEVGRFRFDLGRQFSQVSFNFFDIEESNFSGILEVNGQRISRLLNGGREGNIQQLILSNVRSFVVQFGKPGANGDLFSQTGDGVQIQITAVPEPGTVIGLSFLGIVGILGVRRRKQEQNNS
jgi:hypothetical protein